LSVSLRLTHRAVSPSSGKVGAALENTNLQYAVTLFAIVWQWTMFSGGPSTDGHALGFRD
jgi:hypothetical protein